MDCEGFCEEFAGAEGSLLSEIAGGFHRGGGISVGYAKVAPLRTEASCERLVVDMPLDAVSAIEACGHLSSIGKPDREAVAISPFGFHKRAARKCLNGIGSANDECTSEEQCEGECNFHGQSKSLQRGKRVVFFEVISVGLNRGGIEEEEFRILFELYFLKSIVWIFCRL